MIALIVAAHTGWAQFFVIVAIVAFVVGTVLLLLPKAWPRGYTKGLLFLAIGLVFFALGVLLTI